MPVTSRSNPSRVPGLSGMATPPYSGVSSDPWDNASFISYLFVIELTRGQQIRAIYYADRLEESVCIKYHCMHTDPSNLTT